MCAPNSNKLLAALPAQELLRLQAHLREVRLAEDEVLCDDGSPARFPFLERFAAEHRIAMVSVDQLVEHRLGIEDTRGLGIPLLL